MKKIYLGFNLFYEVYNSGKRTIYAPSKDLKDLQKQILSFIKTKYNIKFSIKDTAKVHCNQKWILKLDIRKFYESVSKEQIKNTIAKIHKDIEFPKHFNKKLLYEMCTLNDKLPTGAVTSCHLANIAFEQTKIDIKLAVFCKKNNLKFSRYMDDMFFSGENKIDLKKAEKYAISLLKEAGFEFSNTDSGIELNSVPSIGVEFESLSLLRASLSALKNYHDADTKNILWRTLATMACKASVKLTTKISSEEAIILWKDLHKCEQPYVCPHGRPTMIEIKNSELQNKFGRE